MRFNVKNMMLETSRAYVPACCGATICSFSPEATEEEIHRVSSQMHGRTTIVVGGKSFPASVKKLYDGVGLAAIDKCNCDKSGECPLYRIPSRTTENAEVLGEQYISKIADNVFILQSVSGMTAKEVGAVIDLLDTGDVLLVITAEHQMPVSEVFRKYEGWSEEKTVHYAHSYGPRKLCVFSYKK